MARRTIVHHGDTLRLEGSLLAPDLLERLASGEGPLQSPGDYRVPKGTKLQDEIGRAFQIARAQWQDLAGPEGTPDPARTAPFLRELFRDALGWGEPRSQEFPVHQGRTYPVSWVYPCGEGEDPLLVPLVEAGGQDLDVPSPRFGVEGGGRRKSPFQMLQEYLNAAPRGLWGLVSNGRVLRLLRDSASLTRPSFLEFDLERILGESRYPDFAVLWRLLHRSRMDLFQGQPGWERWRREGQEGGNRVREGLRDGVGLALQTLGQGFLVHRDNESLRGALRVGGLTPEAFFQQLLRLVYRILFLLVLEERDLLHPPEGEREARELYVQGYSLRRLRGRCLTPGRSGPSDLWHPLRVVFRGLERGEPLLALPALGGLFRQDQCPNLDGATLENRPLLEALGRLRWSRSTGVLAAVDYRNMGSEELGSVYESLLELVPRVDLEARTFRLLGLGEEKASAGNARKTSGSYYTPEPLVQMLVRSALDPVVSDRLASCTDPVSRERALLSLTVLDPACGSGHFLLAAARRLAEVLAQLRSPDGAVTPLAYRHALRDVVPHCLYGVDRNPLAVELARTALWLEGHEPGRPLSFLDHHLVCGDSLLGILTPEQIATGVPVEAFKALSGDHQGLCADLAGRNASALRRLSSGPNPQRGLFASFPQEELAAGHRALEALGDDTPDQVVSKEEAYRRLRDQADRSDLAREADLFLGAFLLPKTDRERCPTTQDLLALRGQEAPEEGHRERLEAASRICREARVLHWPLAFPAPLARGGFDCVLGNPPWERIKLQEQEFFASRHPDVALASNSAERTRRIAWLARGELAEHLGQREVGEAVREAERRLNEAFLAARRTAEAASLYAHLEESRGGRFPTTGTGDVNTYALFAETCRRLMAPRGRAGLVVPTGIATDDGTKAFFASLVEENRLVSLLDFENRGGLFPAVDSRYRFCLLTLGEAPRGEYAFCLTDPDQASDPRRRFVLSREDLALMNPNTRTTPVFRSASDADLTVRIYRTVPVLLRDQDPQGNPWGVRFLRMLDMSNDSGLFRPDSEGEGFLPLYEGKMIHQFDHRWAEYRGEGTALQVEEVPWEAKTPDRTVRPRYWVPRRSVLARIAPAPASLLRAFERGDRESLRATLAAWLDEEERLRPGSVGPLRDAIALALDLPRGPQSLSPTERRDLKALPPLGEEDLDLLCGASSLEAGTEALLDRRSPRWLLGWRDICRGTDERTVIASVLPRVGVGNNLPLVDGLQDGGRGVAAGFAANLCALVLDYVARQKSAGTHMNYFVFKQLPILPPEVYTLPRREFLVPRVLELTYTSRDLAPWAADLGYSGPPYPFCPQRRALLRAELDVFFARLYGLHREDLEYLLDPAEVRGKDYPSETFRVLRKNEERIFGEYRTARWVREAWDRLERLP